MHLNPSSRFQEIDFRRVVAFDYVFSSQLGLKPDPKCHDLLNSQNIAMVLQNPYDFEDNLNLMDPVIYGKEFSKLKGFVIVCLSKITKETVFEKVLSLSKDTGKLF